jgi:GntR family transcriptional repressor for pyruvate dehydrogenase complex
MLQKSSPVFEKIKSNHRLSEEIANRIKKAIFDKKLVPGDKLPSEKELANIFGTSRTTTREGIRLLETSGLLIVKPGQDGGAFVIQPDLSRVQSLITDLIKTKQIRIEHFTDARLMLEPNIVESVLTNITSKEMELLDQNVNEAEEELSKEKPRNVSINIKFHKILIECTRNPIITVIMGLIFDILKTYLREVNPDRLIAKEVVASHREILEAIRERKPEDVRKLLIAHIENVNSNLKDI